VNLTNACKPCKGFPMSCTGPMQLRCTPSSWSCQC
jgi:hypothetical protein